MSLSPYEVREHVAQLRQGRLKMEKQPNILFIIVDALRARNLGCYGYAKQTSPHIDSLAEEGILFENAFSCAPCTYPSLTSIFSGEYPLSHGIVAQGANELPHQKAERLEPGTVFLPEVLKSKGYTTLAVDWLGGWLKRGYDYYSGLGGLVPQRYKLYRLIWKLIGRPLDYAGRRFTLSWANFFYQHKIHARTITEQTIDLIKKVHDRNFFLFVHYWDTHIPYNPPKGYVDRLIRSDYGEDMSIEQVVKQLRPKQGWYIRKRLAVGIKTVNEAMARYDAAIAYVDNEIGRLIRILEAEGILDQTFVIVTSDHGESLAEHQIYFCHHGLYDVTVHVPIIFRYPDRFPRNTRMGNLVQHVDVVPTLLDVVGVDRSLYTDNKSAFHLIQSKSHKSREVVFIEEADAERKRAIRTDRYKYIRALSKEDAVCKECDVIHGGTEELYDLKRDPEEKDNIVEEHTDIAKKLTEKLFEWVSFVNSEKGKKTLPKTKKTQTCDSEEDEKLIAERLRELGYF